MEIENAHLPESDDDDEDPFGFAPVTSMAERSGDPQLDALIEEFKASTWDDEEEGPVPMGEFRDPEYAFAMCGHVTQAFNAFLQSRGIASQAIEMSDEGWAADGTFDQWGYGDRPLETNLGETNEGHAVSMVEMPSGTYLIDWTGSQYNYTEFPMVQRLNQGGSWDRQWTASIDPDYLFVYYKSELRVKKWEHNLREADMLQELLDEFGVDMTKTGIDIDPAEVAAGEIFTYSDGKRRVEHKQLSNPEVREHAEDLIEDHFGEWNLLNGVDRDPDSGQFV
jgi:hypothetical protein